MKPDKIIYHSKNIISHPLFIDVDMGIYPHIAISRVAESHAWYAMLSVDKFQYPRKQTRVNKLIPWSKRCIFNAKRFHSFNITAMCSM